MGVKEKEKKGKKKTKQKQACNQFTQSCQILMTQNMFSAKSNVDLELSFFFFDNSL